MPLSLTLPRFRRRTQSNEFRDPDRKVQTVPRTRGSELSKRFCSRRNFIIKRFVVKNANSDGVSPREPVESSNHPSGRPPKHSPLRHPEHFPRHPSLARRNPELFSRRCHCERCWVTRRGLCRRTWGYLVTFSRGRRRSEHHSARFVGWALRDASPVSSFIIPSLGQS